MRARSPALLVAISGIDGAGKGHVARQVEASLTARGVRVAVISVDPWLRLPQERFDHTDPARHFYERAIRFGEMFGTLVLPLRERRSISIETDAAEETANSYRRRTWEFDDVDVVLLEGIYLFRSPYRSHYDLACWLDCSFETALERVVVRRQEGLGREETVGAYRSIYFPAQEIHLASDTPRESADVVLSNDPSGRPPAGAVTAAAAATS
jgi:uridine kinase